MKKQIKCFICKEDVDMIQSQAFGRTRRICYPCVTLMYLKGKHLAKD